MLRQLIIILLGTILILTACNSGETHNNASSPHGSPHMSEEQGPVEDPASNTEEPDESDRMTEEPDESDRMTEESAGIEEATSSPADIEALFKLMQQATRAVTSVTITGISEMNNIIAGTSVGGTMEMKANAILDPFVQHAMFTSLEGEGGTTEWYANDDDMFIYFEDSGWQRLVHPMSVQAANLFYREEHFDHFIWHKDLFDLSEDNEHYIVTYTGSDELYKDVFYEGMIEQARGSLAQELSDIISDIKMGGSIEMKVSKDSYLIAEQHTIYKSSAESFGMTVEAIQDGIYTYTYNEAGQVAIPQEVLDSTDALPNFLDMVEIP